MTIPLAYRGELCLCLFVGIVSAFVWPSVNPLTSGRQLEASGSNETKRNVSGASSYVYSPAKWDGDNFCSRAAAAAAAIAEAVVADSAVSLLLLLATEVEVARDTQHSTLVRPTTDQLTLEW